MQLPMVPLYLHIGLPKTGTTTLQHDVFPAARCDYRGVDQPRSRRQDPIYRHLYRAINDGIDVAHAARRLRLELERISSAGRPMLVSEEMFTVGPSWREKLNRAAEILEGLDHQVLVTRRDPVDGAFAYYCEIRKDPDRRPLVDTVLSDPSMEIWRGDLLADALAGAFGHDRVLMLRYEDMFSPGRMGLQEALAALGLVLPDDFRPGIHNRTAHDGSHVVKEITVPRVRPVRAPRILAPIRGGAIATRLRSMESWIVPRRTVQHRIPIMDESERSELESWLRPYESALDVFAVAD